MGGHNSQNATLVSLIMNAETNDDRKIPRAFLKIHEMPPGTQERSIKCRYKTFYSFYYLNSPLNAKVTDGELLEHAPAAVPAAVAGNEIFHVVIH